MAAALRFAARRICGGAFERSHGTFTAAASAAVKEEQRRLPPKISHGRSLLRRFSSSEAPNVLNNNKHLPVNNAEPSVSLAGQIQEKKQEMLHLLRQANQQECSMDLENKRLLHLLGRAPGPAPGSAEQFTVDNLFKLVSVALVASAAILYLEAKFIFPLFRREEEQTSPEEAE